MKKLVLVIVSGLSCFMLNAAELDWKALTIPEKEEIIVELDQPDLICMSCRH